MKERVTVIWSDITQLAVDAIVNAANCNLSGGEGVDGAIHWAAGSGLAEECARIGWCDTGNAVITAGHNLPARYVIHTVGPLWHGGGEGEEELLAACYRRCFQLAREHGVRTIAFPAISGGVYRFPLERGSLVAVAEALGALEADPELELVCFVVYSARAREIYLQALERALAEPAATLSGRRGE